jgi:hypothetical protein
LSLVDTEYLTLVSADDALTPGSLHRSVTALERSAEAAFVFGKAIGVEQSSSGLDATSCADDEEPFTATIHDGRSWAESVCLKALNPVSSPEVVVRSSAQAIVGGYRLDLPHTGDLEMWLRLATVGSVLEIGGPVQAIHRWHAGNMSHGYMGTADDLRELVRAFALFEDQAQQAWPHRASMLGATRHAIARRSIRQAIRAAAARDDATRQMAIDFLDLAIEIEPERRTAATSKWVESACRGNAVTRSFLGIGARSYLSVRSVVSR